MAFSMDLPDLDTVQEEVVKELEPAPEVKNQIINIAGTNVDEIMTVDLDSFEDRHNIVSTIDNFGNDLTYKSSQKNQLLSTRVGDLSKAGGETGVVVKSLSDLQLQMKDLDPSAIDFVKQGTLGKLFNPVRSYFAKFEKADNVIADIVVSLGKGKTTLKNDNVTLEIEQAELRDLTKKLNQQIELATQMDTAITDAVEKAKLNSEIDPERIKFIEEEILFTLRQKVLDMQQMQTVNMQGVVAMEVIRRNNKELIRAVERAETVTVSALKIAVTVASALYNQKIVLDKVKAVNEATNNMIQATSKMLKEQGTEIQRQSMETNISVETLKSAFADTFEALDTISNYKQQALPQMQATMQEFKALAKEGEKRIQQLEKRDAILDKHKEN